MFTLFLGMSVIPKEWIKKTSMYEKLDELAEAIVASNSNLQIKVEKGCSLPSLFS
jgi:hypothetical protein